MLEGLEGLEDEEDEEDGAVDAAVTVQAARTEAARAEAEVVKAEEEDRRAEEGSDLPPVGRRRQVEAAVEGAPADGAAAEAHEKLLSLSAGTRMRLLSEDYNSPSVQRSASDHGGADSQRAAMADEIAEAEEGLEAEDEDDDEDEIATIHRLAGAGPEAVPSLGQARSPMSAGPPTPIQREEHEEEDWDMPPVRRRS